MSLAKLRYAPEFQVTINDKPVPAALRASISNVNYQTGLEGADRVELTLVNEKLRWLDQPLFALDNKLTLAIGYAPDPLERVFVGEIVGQEATFPGGGIPTLTIVAQDRLHRLQNGTKARWFALSSPFGNLPIPDHVVAGMVSFENGLIPLADLAGFVLSVAVKGFEVIGAFEEYKGAHSMQKLIRKQVGKSDFEFLQSIAQENGWEMLIDHEGTLGGYKLRFMSPLSHLSTDLTLKYGQSLIDFTPKISEVGQFLGVTARVWEQDIKTEFTVTISWDWDRNSLDISVSLGFGGFGGLGESPKTLDELTDELDKAITKAKTDGKSKEEIKALQDEKDNLGKNIFELVGEPVTLATAPRVILSKLLPTINKRLTGSGNTIGDPRIKAGTVIRLEGLGIRFGGLYRVTSAKHTIDGNGYRTGFEVRKEIWFGSTPLLEQGAVKANLQNTISKGKAFKK